MDILICDDMPLFSHSLSKYIEEYGFDEDVSIACFNTGRELLYYLNQNNASDIIFIDICLGRESGIDIGANIKKLFPHSLLIFVSYSEDFLSELVNVEPFGFVKKPFEKKNIFNVLDRASKRMKLAVRQYFFFVFNGVTYRIDLNDVVYIYSINRIINIKMKNNKEHFFYDKLDTVYDQIRLLHPFFARINKSYIVNVMFVTEYSVRFVFIEKVAFNRSKKYDSDFDKKMKEFEKPLSMI